MSKQRRSKGINAAAWFYSQSFHQEVTPAANREIDRCHRCGVMIPPQVGVLCDECRKELRKEQEGA